MENDTNICSIDEPAECPICMKNKLLNDCYVCYYCNFGMCNICRRAWTKKKQKALCPVCQRCIVTNESLRIITRDYDKQIVFDRSTFLSRGKDLIHYANIARRNKLLMSVNNIFGIMVDLSTAKQQLIGILSASDLPPAKARGFFLN